jgi:pyruvate,water dikinase
MAANETSPIHHGKAVALRDLQANGFLVPEFMVISADCTSEELASRITAIVAQLGLPLAVRSSASVEDGSVSSFAGMFASYLNLSTAADVEVAVIQCRASVRAPSVYDYCRNHRLAANDVRMDVIIQRMIQPELAGVAFTINPVTGQEDIVIEATAGLGDELLSGRKSSLPADSPLLLKHSEKIIDSANRVAAHFGSPQDIEFAIQDDVIWLLQSRPITRIGTLGIKGEWTNANFREGGVSSSVCSPLMWSLYNLIWDSSLRNCLREIKLLSFDFVPGRMFFGRPYWNLGALKQCLTRIPGFVEREFDADLGIEVNYEGDGIRTPVTPWNLVRVLPSVFAIRKFLKRQMAVTTGFLNGGYEQSHRKYEIIPQASGHAFRTLVEEDYLQFETNYFRTIFALSLAKLEFKHFFPDVGFSALMSNLPEVRHTAPLRRIEQMVRAKSIDLKALLADFGHHYHIGLDIRHPRWDEDPEYVEFLLQQASAEVSPSPTIDASPDPGGYASAANGSRSPDHTPTRGSSHRDFEQAVDKAQSTLPVWKRVLFRRKLQQLRQLVWLREEMRDYSNRMYHLLRKYVLQIASERNIGDDIFFMTYQEIFVDDRSAIEQRRSTYNRFRNFTPPHEVGQSQSRRHSSAIASNRFQTTLYGLSASPGTVQGTARVVSTAKEAIQLPPGSILVCPHTDPGWTPALSRASGVITEAGGMLSHAAVLCREFRLPAVLSVPHVCSRIPDGSTVLINGDEGIIQLLNQGV